MELFTKAINYSYLTELIGHLSGLAHLRATQLCTEALADLDLTPKQFVALEFIANNPTTCQKEIAAHIGTTPTVMVSVLDALTARGDVERVRSLEDRRRHSIALTPQGNSTREAVRQAALTVEERLFEESDLSREEWQQLIRLMQKLTNRKETP
ncbi:MAG: MarR family transcriptional regulator [Chloroflexota bacterium]